MEENLPSTTTDSTVNSLQLPAFPIYDSLEDKPMEWTELAIPPADLLTSSTSPFPPIDKQTVSSQEIIEYVSNTPNHNLPPILLNDKNKRPISETSLPLKSPTTTNIPVSLIVTNKPTKKKVKISSRTNSFSNLDDTTLENPLKLAEEIFINNNNHPLSLLQFQYVIENFSHNAINIYSLCQQVNADIPTLIDITEKIRPIILDRAMKSKLTKLANLLFKSMVPQEDKKIITKKIKLKNYKKK